MSDKPLSDAELFNRCALLGDTLGLALNVGVSEKDAADALKPLMKETMEQAVDRNTSQEDKKRAAQVSPNNVDEAILSKIPAGELRESVRRCFATWGDSIPLEAKKMMALKLVDRPISTERAKQLFEFARSMMHEH